MAGHSKWANIQHRKGRQDEKRGRVFSRLAKEITVAARMGGGDAAFNPRLRLAVDRAKAVNMPAEYADRLRGDATRLFEAMLYKGVIVRSMKAYGYPEFIRITVGTQDENDELLAALREVLGTGASQGDAK